MVIQIVDFSWMLSKLSLLNTGGSITIVSFSFIQLYFFFLFINLQTLPKGWGHGLTKR